MKIESRVRALKVAAAITIGFGIVPTVFLLELVIPQLNGESMSASSIRLLAAISGGVLTGWGLMIWLVASEILANHPILARRLILPSIVTWFIIDSSMSVAAGAPLNAFLNLGFLLMFTLPILGSESARAEAA